MPSGHVKVFHPDRNFGFLVSESGEELYIAGTEVSGEPLRSGDEVEYEVADTENGRKAATGISVTKQAPADNPVGRTMVEPPSWDELEERERQRRMARRRRR
jgi:cold shock CspA family protein